MESSLIFINVNFFLIKINIFLIIKCTFEKVIKFTNKQTAKQYRILLSNIALGNQYILQVVL